jgi:type I restriction enzyme S subunit
VRVAAYKLFKSSTDVWLGDIPEHWSAMKLKYIASCIASNVDKKSKDGEMPVQLCNYTDVYYNDRVTVELPYMRATATPEQIKKFTLLSGDTVITKDSEGPDDIAIPTFVEESMPGVICGYHLSIVRPSARMDPRYLNLVFKCGFARSYFATRANGLTRYGLGSRALESVVFPIPPRDEQTQIAKFVDHEMAKIDMLIDRQQQLIALLKEKCQAVISHAVTRGLNPDAPVRDSGVDWLGEVPAHWVVRRLKHVSPMITVGIVVNPSAFASEEGVPFVHGGDIRHYGINLDTVRRISPDHSAKHPKTKLNEGDVVTIRVGATRGISAVVPRECQGGNCASVMLTRRGDFDSEWLCRVMNDRLIQFQIELVEYGAAQPQFNISHAIEFWLPVPPPAEQIAISSYLAERSGGFEKLVNNAIRSVELLRERRTALISAAVTGKIDVRNWKPPASAAPTPETGVA